MRNAKEELLSILAENNNTIKCASLDYGLMWKEGENQNFKLPVNHTNLELTAFMESLDFNYYSGFGGQELYGIVWLEDGTWLSRGEYDGSEWWIHNVMPEIPENLL